MAENKKPIKKRQLKKSSTIRERAEKSGSVVKNRRLKQARSSIANIVKPIKRVTKTGRKEYYLPLPDNKIGRFLNKRRRFIPSYFRSAWAEVRQVEWPNNRETIKLTFAVFIFAIFFMIFISAADFGLDKVFKKLILK